jgi:hypothetical protein
VLREGIAEITFADGAMVHLEGPARFVVQSPGRGVLQFGKLFAQVPARAIGFCVETPALKVVDLGTEFGVQADESGAAEVQVIQGLVNVGPPPASAKRATFGQVRLAAGQMIECDSHGSSKVVDAPDPQRFTHLAFAGSAQAGRAAAPPKVVFATDPGWVGAGNQSDGNGYGFRAKTRHAGGEAGEVGGKLVRSRRKSFYGDTHLNKTFTLNDRIAATGRFCIAATQRMDGQVFVGHYSADDFRREFVGMEISEGINDKSTVRVRARLFHRQADGVLGAISAAMELPVGRHYRFEYSYDPAFHTDNQLEGPEGKVTLRVFSDDQKFDQTCVALLEPGHRAIPAEFDAFGMGIAAHAVDTDDAENIVEVYIDEVSYSGYQGN